MNLTAAKRLEDPDLVSSSYRALELAAVLDVLAGYALSVPGKEAVLHSRPGTDLREVRTCLETVGELREYISLEGPFGLADLLPMTGLLERLANPAVIFDVQEILAVRDMLWIASLVRRRMRDLPERLARLTELARVFVPLDALSHRISAVFDEHGGIQGNASARLKDIRDRTVSLRRRVIRRLEGVVENRDLSRIVQEDYVTLRNDRYVILLRPDFKGLLDGIIHDHSRSGQSVYVEPLEVVELNNQVASLADEEQEEIRRILRELTGQIRDSKEDLLRDFLALVELDALQARALYASETQGVAPEFVESGLRLLKARHPLLLAQPDIRVVPMDIIQEAPTPATVISGPNMGGKTVALKIAGLFPLMARCGIMLPAAEGTCFAPFPRVMADIGDEQSLAGRISTFSGHMLRIKGILDTAQEDDLVLLDEVGSATDPEEGSALAMAIVTELVRKGARVIVTTHLTQLKAFAVGRPEIKNLSVELDPKTLQPTFRILYDLPGESHAIETAERIGIPAAVITEAREYADRASGGTTRFVVALREKLEELERQRNRLDDKEKTLEGELARIHAERAEIIDEFRSQARSMIKEAERRIFDLQRSLKKGLYREGPQAHQMLRGIEEDVTKTLGVPLEKPPPELHPGTRVLVRSLGREGVVREVLEKTRAEVSVGTMKIRVESEDLVILGGQEKKPSNEERIRVDIPLARPRRDVNVIGMRAEEALQVVDKAVDQAILAGISELNVIHGKGTGRLRQAVSEYLAGHSMVRGVRPATIQEGGAGVTVVELVSE
ncbi:MAG: endonuclease MutS2 [Thermodesulfobacteriota bacterium]